MFNDPLPIARVTIHCPSCKRNGISCADFAEEIKNRVKEYKFEFIFESNPIDVFAHCGITMISIWGTNNQKLMELLCSIFSELSSKKAL